MLTLADSDCMHLIFCMPNDFDRLDKKSFNLILSMVNHKGQGSLYQCLKSFKYITSINFSLNFELMTAFRLITISLGLTNSGILNYKKVFAVILEFFRIVREDWLAGNKPIDFFNENKTITEFSWKTFNVADPETNVTLLS